jgi:hypothetical protein
MDLTYYYSDVLPQIATYYRHLGQRVYTINFNVQEIEDNELGKYRYNSVTLPVGKYDRDTIINTIIRYKYREDEMEATINNYLLDSEDEETVNSFKEMQEWRRLAKDTAKEVLEIIK